MKWIVLSTNLVNNLETGDRSSVWFGATGYDEAYSPSLLTWVIILDAITYVGSTLNYKQHKYAENVKEMTKIISELI